MATTLESQKKPNSSNQMGLLPIGTTVASPLKKGSNIVKSTNVPCHLTDERKAILSYLGEWRFGTSTQIWQQLQSAKDRTHTLGELNKLRRAGLIKSFKFQLERGNVSELCWQLTRLGATKIELTYGTQHKRKPTRERITWRDMELDLIRAVEFAGWSLICPIDYSPTRPMPKQTPQYFKLVESINALETERIKTALMRGQINQSSQTYINYQEQQHLWGLPGQINDYVTYLDNDSQEEEIKPAAPTIVVMILCPPHAGIKSWESKLEKYARFAKYLSVYGIFQDERARQIGEGMLNKLAAEEKNKRLLTGNGANFQTVILSEVYNLLEGLQGL